MIAFGPIRATVAPGWLDIRSPYSYLPGIHEIFLHGQNDQNNCNTGMRESMEKERQLVVVFYVMVLTQHSLARPIGVGYNGEGIIMRQ
jgi:hypothetical protein